MSLTTARQRRIVELVENDREVLVVELARLLSVSEMTIRRDLKQLEAAGKLTRVHGGAVPRPVPATPPLRERDREQRAAKHAIAELAASLVESGHRLYLGSGSTTLALARVLAVGPPCRILTNVTDHLEALVGDGRHELDLTGGRYDPPHRGFYGGIALDAVRDRVFDISFVSAYAIDTELGPLDQDYFQFDLQRILARQARLNVVLADHTKFGRPGNFRPLPWAAVGIFITDRRPDDVFCAHLAEAGTRLMWASDEPA